MPPSPAFVATPPIEPNAGSRPVDTLLRRIDERTAMVGVVGLGYVGLPLILAAADAGFDVIGIDRDREKISSLRAGRSYVPDISDADISSIGDAQFTSDVRVLVAADIVIVTVPTPLTGGTPDLALVCSAMDAISSVLRPGQLVVLESTTYPGTTEEVVRPILEESGLVAGVDFALAYSPERINPAGGVPFRATPKIVAGLTPACGAAVDRFYAAVVDRVVRTSTPRSAEMAKLIENTFRQVNIALVNELATVSPDIGVDIWEALDAAATKPFGYLPFWPGPGVGGHCIAVDPTYLSWRVEQQLGFGIGFVEHARAVNNRMPAHVAARVAETLNGAGRALNGARVLVLGLTYKPGVDDIRESPALAVVQRLHERGADLRYHDPFVPEVTLDDAGPTPNGRRLASSPLTDADLAESDCVVVLTAHPGIDYDRVVASAPLVFDAVGVTRHQRDPKVVLL